MSKRNYITEVQAYDETQLDVDSNCNTIMFSVATVSTVFINGFPVATGGVLFIDGNEDETNVTRYRLAFGTGNTGQVFVMRKKYTTGI